ncbi:glutathione S-transferase [Acetobacteraceae bacterium H6797]|nr:glutathione S-transferase [Acetobacteraceae bacterium H6797]
MKLHWSPRSPFVRKVMIAAHELGLVDRFERVRTVVAMKDPNIGLLSDNPLGKIPTLVLDDGRILFDSVVICEYFDSIAEKPTLFPASGPERFDALRRHALGTGYLDMLILWRNERDKEAPFEPWLKGFSLKHKATLASLEAEAETLGKLPFGIGHIAIGCALSYMDFRFADLGWREGHPKLHAWHETFRARPSVKATEIVDG